MGDVKVSVKISFVTCLGKVSSENHGPAAFYLKNELYDKK